MGTTVQPLHFRAVTSVVPHCRRVATPVLPRCPRARSAAHLRSFSRCEARNLCYLCLKEQRKQGERAIARSMKRLHRGFTIHDYYVGPITWVYQEMGKHFTDVELVSTSH